ncbi:helix-turn-helix domain-containing protein [Clostridium tertium]|uniref:helix-turn-helix domain-containing protein n=1 Tax=Clostridium tertium TaxID=1559 RepID=UPI00356AF642
MSGINNRIKIIRKAENLSQEEFGKRINLSRSQIGCYENGIRDITERSINDIAREFNINREWLLTGEGEMYNKISDEEEFAFLMGTLAASDNPQLKALINVLSQIDNEEDLDLILNLCKRLAAKKED